jgi:cell division protease FtsH
MKTAMGPLAVITTPLRLPATATTSAATAGSVQTSSNFATELQQWLPLALLALLLLVMIYIARRSMPATKPATIRPDETPQIGWEDIAGVDEAKAELREVVDYLREPRRFARVGASVPTGILLHGPPGTGKTLLAKAAAHESGAVFFSQPASAFVEVFGGLGSARIRRLFKAARKHAPAIVFIDEIDAVGTARSGGFNREYDQTLNQLLVEMDGFGSTGDVVVIAASNILDKLDPALLRPGRFDRQIFVSPPDVTGRERILRVHTRRKPIEAAVDFPLLARQTAGLTGADLENICNEAAINCVRRGVARIGMVDFDHALERAVAGIQSRRRLSDHERRVVAFHEAGHAVCAELLPSVDPVHRISIVPHGRALGYTLNLPEEDRYLKTREELIDMMTMLLGGRASEELTFGSITNGAADDLGRVTAIAHSMVHEWAMGTGITAMRIERGDTSEALRRVIDDEVRELADEALRGAVELLAGHRPQLEAIAAQLLAQESLERADIDRVMAGVPGARPDRRPGAHLGLAASDPTARPE